MKPRSQIRGVSTPSPDPFDQIPDSLVHFIFNKMADVRFLRRCAAVSKRFNSLVPLVQDIYVKIDRVITVDGDPDVYLNLSSPRPRKLSHLLKLMLFAILKPIHNLHKSNGGNKPLLPQISHHSPAQVLKNFRHIRNLQIELPASEVGTEDGIILKWRAVFGSTLQSCVILAGTLVNHMPASADQEVEDDGIPEQFYANGGLKLRLVWTISSLIAASTRHYLLQQIIKDHPTLESVVLMDADGQGTLNMGAGQLKEFREKPLAAAASSNRTQIPASSMKLRYAPYLELPGKMAMQGATLVVIKPNTEDNSSNSSRKEDELFINGVFDGPLGAAVKALANRSNYPLEINGF
ncbi:F-box protein [Canna indica]|uniref:F-box protein n=1 Tax=Canna indica TaxID=4628 RepID=A0AAQ3L0H1_9LILI|nr:F-box protein [Canna indica]